MLLYATKSVFFPVATRGFNQNAMSHDVSNVSVSIGAPDFTIRFDNETQMVGSAPGPSNVRRALSDNSMARSAMRGRSAYEMVHLDSSVHQLDVSLHVDGGQREEDGDDDVESREVAA